MIGQLFAIYDAKAEVYSPPFVAANPAMACRMVQDVLRNPDHSWSVHSMDFTLYCVGQWDDSVASVVGHPPIEIARVTAIGAKEV